MTGISEKSKRRILEIEEEFGDTFDSVVSGFAADGHSLTDTAGILGYTHTLFKKHLSILGISVSFCKPSESIAVKDFHERRKNRELTESELSARRYALSCIFRR